MTEEISALLVHDEPEPLGTLDLALERQSMAPGTTCSA